MAFALQHDCTMSNKPRQEVQQIQHWGYHLIHPGSQQEWLTHSYEDSLPQHAAAFMLIGMAAEPWSIPA